MSTRSRIAIKNNDGSYTSIYCHNDGYPSYNGRMLDTYYNDKSIAQKLINLGDISSLQKNLEPTGDHSFDNPEEDVTIAYGRDRGETNVDPIKSSDIDELQADCDACDAEYAYVFDNDHWDAYRVTHYSLEPIELDSMYESNLTRSILNNLNESFDWDEKCRHCGFLIDDINDCDTDQYWDDEGNRIVYHMCPVCCNILEPNYSEEEE